MQQPTPSPKPSAWVTATLRAAHQLFDTPLILADAMALRILGAERAAQLQADAERHRHPLAVAMRTTMVVRARLAEDCWREAHQAGVDQLVILGAGLDTYAYRADCPAGARIFEVDLPATQQWKRACLREAGIAEPAALRFVEADFTQASVLNALTLESCADEAPAFFSMLGVSMYLRPDDVMRTLQDIATCAPGSSIVFDYCVPAEHLTPMERAGLEAVTASLAAQGEPLLSSFDAQRLEHMLRRFGFRQVEHFGPDALTHRYLAGRDDGLRLSGIFQMIRATL